MLYKGIAHSPSSLEFLKRAKRAGCYVKFNGTALAPRSLDFSLEKTPRFSLFFSQSPRSYAKNFKATNRGNPLQKILSVPKDGGWKYINDLKVWNQV